MRAIRRLVTRCAPACAVLTTATGAALVPLLPVSATAQVTVSTSYATGCGPGTGCAQIWFTIMNGGATDVAFNNLTVTRSSTSFAFSPRGGTGSYDGQDDLGPLAGFTSVSADGSQLFIDFINTGDPMNPGFPFTVFAGGSGMFETTIDPTTAPENAGTLQFALSGQLAAGGTLDLRGNAPVTTPEPPLVALMTPVLLTFLTKRRRRGHGADRR